MTNFKRKAMAVGMAFFVSAGAFAQKRGEDKPRPPKPENTPKVVVQPKEKPPNNNQGDKRNDGKKGRG
ncbi:MAG: hypothetical protein ND895_11515 [Pyrinomonadaceae bacterium]|nr:hypothetical protein [Pyrinomonadaceae bacterium]